MATTDSFAQQIGQNAASAATQPRSPVAAKISTPAQARKAGQDFEAMFIGQMMQQMFNGLQGEKVFGGGGSAEKMFRPMLVDEYAKLTAKRGGFGIADAVAHTLLKAQEAQAQGPQG